jgi:hypothetical protein
MERKNPDSEPVEGQGDDLDRGARKAHDDASNDRDGSEVLDDEYARPPHDRSPLT